MASYFLRIDDTLTLTETQIWQNPPRRHLDSLGSTKVL